MEIVEKYQKIRALTEKICEPLEIEDYVIQSCEDVSPPKWHLAHTSWLFENFFLKKFYPEYRFYNRQYNELFNSYYQSFGKIWHRPERGCVSRPTVKEVYEYRRVVDQRVSEALFDLSKRSEQEFHEAKRLITLGLNHEQQHQELLLMDIKNILFRSYQYPKYKEFYVQTSHHHSSMIEISEGIYEIGTNKMFRYDQEGPRHKVYLRAFHISDRPVTNGEYLEFMEEGGYQKFQYWFDDAWSVVQQNNWQSPLYWQKVDGKWMNYRLNGFVPIDPTLPVCHVSHYEASAFAKWKNSRLPTEQEWEVAAGQLHNENSNFLDLNTPETTDSKSFFGNTWEWTASSFLPYPGYEPPKGVEAEYNSKFMSGQMVLRGGSFATPADHFRVSYRNFFQPDKRWAFSGIRLAKDQ